MSGLELLGVVASTAQLIAYVITVSSKLNEIRCKIRNAPKKLEQYDRQFKELIAIAKQMEENPPIQTKELDLCLTTIFAKTEAIKGILTNFEQSSKSRRRWNIMSGDLSRQLDECFGDVKNTMGNLVVLITSQNAYDQKELKELVLGYTKIATASTQISTTATPLSYSTESTLNLIEYERRKAGSHTFKGLTIRGNGTVSMGNSSTPYGAQPRMVGHSFTGFTVSGNKVLHIGNTGTNSEGHVFDAGVVENNEATMLGDYADLDQKFQDTSLQRDSAISLTHGKDMRLTMRDTGGTHQLQ